MTSGRVLHRPAASDEEPTTPASRKPADADISTGEPPAAADTPSSNPPAPGGGGRSDLVRVTVNLTSRVYDALEEACAKTGDTKTDTINRAILVYQLIHRLSEEGGGTLTLISQDGTRERLHLL